MTQDQLLELASRIGMLEGHARKWVKSLTKQAVSPSKIDLIFNGERSSPNPMNRRASSQVANVGEQQPQQKTSVGEDTIAQGATYDINYDKGDTNEGQQVTDGDKAIFYFIKAAKLRTCEDKVLPKMQDLRRQKPDWFVEKEISLDKAVNHEYVDKVLSVSHRWEKPGDPDIKGVQFAAIKTHLNSPQGKKFELVWMDYYCAPQKERNAEERIFEQTLRFVATSSSARPSSSSATVPTRLASGRSLRRGSRCRRRPRTASSPPQRTSAAARSSPSTWRAT